MNKEVLEKDREFTKKILETIDNEMVVLICENDGWILFLLAIGRRQEIPRLYQ